MTNWFYFLALGITLLFIVCFVIIFFCALKIYYNVQRSLLKARGKRKMNDLMQIITLISIWLSQLMSIITLTGAVRFWLKHSKVLVRITPLKRYPKVTIVVPDHNEEAVIEKTATAILDLNYPKDKLEILFYADNCEDKTADVLDGILAQPQYQGRDAQ